MNEQQIKKHLKYKFESWLNSINDTNLQKVLRENTIITGGAISSMLLDQEINDYDLYFKSKYAVKSISEHYIRKFHTVMENGTAFIPSISTPQPLTFSLTPLPQPPKFNDESSFMLNYSFDLCKGRTFGPECKEISYEDLAPEFYVEDNLEGGMTIRIINNHLTSLGNENKFNTLLGNSKKKSKKKKEKNFDPIYNPVIFTPNAVTLTNDIQLVTRFCGTPEEIHESFDMEHCTCYWDASTDRLVLPPKALKSILTKELRIRDTAPQPISTLVRINKMLGRGYTINPPQLIKASLLVAKLNVDDDEVVWNNLRGLYASDYEELRELFKEESPGTNLLEWLLKELTQKED